MRHIDWKAILYINPNPLSNGKQKSINTRRCRWISPKWRRNSWKNPMIAGWKTFTQCVKNSLKNPESRLSTLIPCWWRPGICQHQHVLSGHTRDAHKGYISSSPQITPQQFSQLGKKRPKAYKHGVFVKNTWFLSTMHFWKPAAFRGSGNVRFPGVMVFSSLCTIIRGSRFPDAPWDGNIYFRFPPWKWPFFTNKCRQIIHRFGVSGVDFWGFLLWYLPNRDDCSSGFSKDTKDTNLNHLSTIDWSLILWNVRVCTTNMYITYHIHIYIYIYIYMHSTHIIPYYTKTKSHI